MQNYKDNQQLDFQSLGGVMGGLGIGNPNIN